MRTVTERRGSSCFPTPESRHMLHPGVQAGGERVAPDPAWTPTFASMGRERVAPAMHQTQQHAVNGELDKACGHLDRNPGRDRWHAVLRRLSERLVAHEDAADEPGEEHRMADRTPGLRQLRVQIRHNTALDQHRENAEGEDGLRPEVCHRSVVRRVHAEVRHRLGREGRDHVGEYRQEVFPHRPPPKVTCVMQGIYEVACQPPATAGRSSLYGTSSSRGAPRTKTSSPGGKESPPTS